MTKRKRALCLLLISLLLLSWAQGAFVYKNAESAEADFTPVRVKSASNSVIQYAPRAARLKSGEIIPTTVVTDEVNVSSRIWELLFGQKMAAADASGQLIVGGDVFGARIYQGYIELCSDISNMELCAGDIIRSVDGKEVSSVRDLAGILEIGEKRHTVLIKRNGETVERHTESAEDCRALINAVRDGAAGIGTVTYIDPADMSFGGLGHGICDESGAVLPLSEGKVTGVIIGGAVKGEKGHPGELSGILTNRGIGEILQNTNTGVFGRLSEWRLDKSSAIPIAKRDEVKAGAATIISTVKNGKKMSYSVELYDINTGETGTKCFKVRVTDKALISMTGGIVRGMSGSPIIQDGKLVGAVTHVMVANPTEGYGIFIENMLSAASGGTLPKAA